uniref:Olfactory receptor 9Q1 n=1 Tax=Nannospalax galili TaxID=1026970 RepID=A0A8C6RBE0_NANGA
MAKTNLTLVTEFFLIAFTECPEQAVPLFHLFLFISHHFVGELGHDHSDPHGSLAPYTPIYFLLSHFSLMDICFPSITVPQPMAVLLEHGTTLSYTCLPWCGQSQHLLSPFVETMKSTSFSVTSPLLLKLTCGDSYTQEVVIIVFPIFVIPASMVVIVVSYLFIIVAILRIPSAGGQAKTFSTCTSHLTAVSLFFGTLIFMYLRDNSGQASEQDQVVSVFYTTVIPMLNPLIYSLRNKEVKEALRKVLSRIRLS